jgi:polyhydroxyalkanoate synthesis regulator phasin
MRKPIGITVPYRDTSAKTMTHWELLEEKINALEKRIQQLEKEKK